MVSNFASVFLCWSCLVSGMHSEEKLGSELWGRWKAVGGILSETSSRQHAQLVLYLMEEAKAIETIEVEFRPDGTAVWYVNGKVHNRARLQFIAAGKHKIAHWVDPKTGEEKVMFYRVQGDILLVSQIIGNYKKLPDPNRDYLDPFSGSGGDIEKWIRVKEQGISAQ